MANKVTKKSIANATSSISKLTSALAGLANKAATNPSALVRPVETQQVVYQNPQSVNFDSNAWKQAYIDTMVSELQSNYNTDKANLDKTFNTNLTNYQNQLSETNQDYDANIQALQRQRYQDSQEAKGVAFSRGLGNGGLGQAIEQTANLNAVNKIADTQNQRTRAINSINTLINQARYNYGIDSDTLLKNFNADRLKYMSTAELNALEKQLEVDMYNTDWSNKFLQDSNKYSFESGENDKKYKWQADQNALDRLLQVSESQKDRNWQSSENDKKYDWEALQNSLDREWKSGESQKDRDWQSGESQKDRDWKSGESQKDRDWKSSEAQKDRDAETALAKSQASFRGSGGGRGDGSGSSNKLSKEQEYTLAKNYLAEHGIGNNNTVSEALYSFLRGKISSDELWTIIDTVINGSGKGGGGSANKGSGSGRRNTSSNKPTNGNSNGSSVRVYNGSAK